MFGINNPLLFQVMTRLHSLKVENEQRQTHEEIGEIHRMDEISTIDDDVDELTIDIPRLLGEGSATKRMALPDGETVVVTFRMPNPDTVRGSRPSSLLRSRYETIDEERESVTDSDKSSHLGENGTTADNELSDDSIKERQRIRCGSGRFSRRKRSFEQPLLTTRYDKGEKNEFNILDEDEGKDVDDASSEAGFEPQDNGAMLRSWGIKPRLSRWNDYMDLSEMTSSPTDDHSDSNLLSSIGSPCRDNVSFISKKSNSISSPGNMITTVATINAIPPPVTIHCSLDNDSDTNHNPIMENNNKLPNIITMDEPTCDSDPTSLESTNKKQLFGVCDLKWKQENKKLLKLPMGSPGTFVSSKPTDIDAAFKESRMIYEFLEANYSRSLPFLSAKGKPTDIDSVSNQLLTLSTEEIEGGMVQGLRCSSSPSIPNCKASEVFQFARPDSSDGLTECLTQRTTAEDQQTNLTPSGNIESHTPHLKHSPVTLTSSTDGSRSSIDRPDISNNPRRTPQANAPTSGLILQPQEYIKNFHAAAGLLPLPLTPVPNSETGRASASPIRSTQINISVSANSPRSVSGDTSPAVTINSINTSLGATQQSEFKNVEQASGCRRPDMSKGNSLSSTQTSSQDSTTELKSLDLGYPQVIGCEQTNTGITYVDRPNVTDQPINNDSSTPTTTDVTSGSIHTIGSPLTDQDSQDTKDNMKVQRMSSRESDQGTTGNLSTSTNNASTTKYSDKSMKSHADGGPPVDTRISASTPEEKRNELNQKYASGSDRQHGQKDSGDGTLLGTLDEEHGGDNSGEYTSCDEISLLADDHVYDSNERVNTDVDDDFNDEEFEDFSDDFASETFTELEKLADEGSVEHLVDDGFCSPDFSDLPMDQTDQSHSFTPQEHPKHDEKAGIKRRAADTSKGNYFRDATLSSVDDKVQNWRTNIPTRSILDVLRSKQASSAGSTPNRTPSKSYVQSSTRETTFLPDSHKCVSESTLGTWDSSISNMEPDSTSAQSKGPRRVNVAGSAIVKTPARSTSIPRAASTSLSSKGKDSSLSAGSRRIAAALARKHDDRSIINKSSVNSGQRPQPRGDSVSAKTSFSGNAPNAKGNNSKTKPAGLGTSKGMGNNKSGQNLGIKGQQASRLPAAVGSTSQTGPKSRTPVKHQQGLSQSKQQATPKHAGSSLAKQPQSSLSKQHQSTTDKQQTLDVSKSQQQDQKQQQAASKMRAGMIRQTENNKFGAKQQHSNIPLQQSGGKAVHSGSVQQSRAGAQAGSKGGHGPHNVHGIPATQLQTTPRTAKKITSRVTTI